jgi:hypothetical protein
LLESVLNIVKEKILSVITTSSTETIIEPLLKTGFVVGDEGVNHLKKYNYGSLSSISEQEH